MYQNICLPLQHNKDTMQNDTLNNRQCDPHFSVDCVLVGFNGEQLCVLLVRLTNTTTQRGETEYKLPGSLIYVDEEFDDAAHRVMKEMTGLKDIDLHQFHTFGSPHRLHDAKDQKWLTHFYSLHTPVQRLISVAYTALIKIGRRQQKLNDRYEACWVPIEEVPALAFDHNQILRAAMRYIRTIATTRSDVVFNLLPSRFTAAQVRRLFEIVYNHTYDIRNFHKLLAKMPYIVPTDEWEENVAHRAARYFRFDRKIYNKTRA